MTRIILMIIFKPENNYKVQIIIKHFEFNDIAPCTYFNWKIAPVLTCKHISLQLYRFSCINRACKQSSNI